MPGVYVTAVGYAGGQTPNPTYEETCTGRTGHAEVVRVIFDPTEIGLPELLRAFWEAHDLTQGMRQGNDIGTQYRSVIYTTNELQRPLVDKSLQEYDQALQQQGMGNVTTEVAPLDAFYYAEEYYQQYLAKNPAGYCGLKGTGVACPVTEPRPRRRHSLGPAASERWGRACEAQFSSCQARRRASQDPSLPSRDSMNPTCPP